MSALTARVAFTAYMVALSAASVWIASLITIHAWETLNKDNRAHLVDQHSSSLSSRIRMLRISIANRHSSSSKPRSSITSHSSRSSPSKVLWCAVICSWSYTLATLSALAVTVIIFSKLGWNQNLNSDQDPVRSKPVVRWCTLINMVFYNVGYSSLIYLCIERLHGLLQGTSFALNNQQMKICRSMVGFVIFCLISSLVFWAIRLRLIAGILAALIVLIYPSLSLWISYKYIRSTSNLACHMGSTSMSSNWAHTLLDVSLRLSIANSAAVLSSAIMFVSFTLRLAYSSTEKSRHFSQTFYVTDPALNAFCILYGFSKGKRMYQLVFGRIHRFFLSKLIKNNQESDNNHLSARNDGTAVDIAVPN